MADSHGMTLSGAERAAFQRDGVVLPAATVAARHVAAMAAVVAALRRTGGSAARARIEDPHRFGDAAAAEPFCACAADATLGRLIVPLLGGAPMLWRSALLHVGEADGPAVGWRADAASWPARPRAALAVRIALEPADRANGCPKLLPRPHERLVRALRNARDRTCLTLGADAVDAVIALDVVGAAGALTLYDVDTLICEPVNPSARGRAAVVLHYIPAGDDAPAG